MLPVNTKVILFFLQSYVQEFHGFALTFYKSSSVRMIQIEVRCLAEPETKDHELQKKFRRV